MKITIIYIWTFYTPLVRYIFYYTNFFIFFIYNFTIFIIDLTLKSHLKTKCHELTILRSQLIVIGERATNFYGGGACFARKQTKNSQKYLHCIKRVLVPQSAVDKQLGFLEGTVSVIRGPGAQPRIFFWIFSNLNVGNGSFCPNLAQILPEKVIWIFNWGGGAEAPP